MKHISYIYGFFHLKFNSFSMITDFAMLLLFFKLLFGIKGTEIIVEKHFLA